MEILELSLLSLDRSSMQNPRNIFKPLLKHIDLNTKLVWFSKLLYSFIYQFLKCRKWIWNCSCNFTRAHYWEHLSSVIVDTNCLPPFIVFHGPLEQRTMTSHKKLIYCFDVNHAATISKDYLYRVHWYPTRDWLTSNTCHELLLKKSLRFVIYVNTAPLMNYFRLLYAVTSVEVATFRLHNTSLL